MKYSLCHCPGAQGQQVTFHLDILLLNTNVENVMTTGWTGDRAIISLLQPLSEATLLEGI